MTTQLITYSEAAEIAGVVRGTIGKWVAQGKLKLYEDGLGRRRVSRSEVEALAEFVEVKS